MTKPSIWSGLSARHKQLLTLLALLALIFTVPALRASYRQPPPEILAYQRPLAVFLQRTAPGSQVQVLQTAPLRVLVTAPYNSTRCLELELELRGLLSLGPWDERLRVVPGHAPWRPSPLVWWAMALACALLPLGLAGQHLACALYRKGRTVFCFTPAVTLAGVLCLHWPLWTLVPSLLVLLGCLPRRRSNPRGVREAAVILMSYPPDFSARCFRLLEPDQVQQINRSLARLSDLTTPRRARILSAFRVEMSHTIHRLGVKGREGGDADPDLVVRILQQNYLVKPAITPAPFPIGKPTVNFHSRSRRRIYSCPICDEVFIDEVSLRRHQLTHFSRTNWRRRAGSALVLLAAVSTLWSFWPRTHHLFLPEARTLTGAESSAITEAERLLTSSLLVVHGRERLLLAAAPSDLPLVQSVLNEYGAGPVLQLPLAPQRWRWLPAAELGLGLLLLMWRPRFRPQPVAEAPDPAETSERPSGPLVVEDLTVDLSRALMGLVDGVRGNKLLARMASLRKHLAQELGLPLAGVQFRDNLSLAPGDYVIRLRGVEVARGSVVVDQFLAIGPSEKLSCLRGLEAPDPTYGMPGKWITPEQRGDAERLSCMIFEPVSVIATQITELIRSRAATLLSLDQVSEMLEHERLALLAAELGKRGIDRLVIWQVLRLLLQERVSIRNLLTILEALAENVRLTQEPVQLAEFARQALAGEISSVYANKEKVLNVICLDPAIEKTLEEAELDPQLGTLKLDPERGNELLWTISKEVSRLQDRGLQPVLLCGPGRRPWLRRLTERSFPSLAILSWMDIAPGYNVNCVAMATLDL